MLSDIRFIRQFKAHSMRAFAAMLWFKSMVGMGNIVCRALGGIAIHAVGEFMPGRDWIRGVSVTLALTLLVAGCEQKHIANLWIAC